MDVSLVNCMKNIEIYIFCDNNSYFSDMIVITQVSLITTGVHMGQIGTLVHSLIMMINLAWPFTDLMTIIYMIVMHGLILIVQIKWKLFVKLWKTAIPQNLQPHPQQQQLLHQQKVRLVHKPI